VVTDVHCSLPASPSNVFHTGGKMSRPEHRGIPRTIDLMDSLLLNRNQISRRRSSRIALNTHIGLSGQDRQKSSFTMPARATNLNKHGAAVQLHRELVVGSIVVVKNKRGTQVSARVVAQLGARQGIPTYAIEFVEQDDRATNFWGIAFPPNANTNP
jgi:hypothetical protein